MEFMGGVHQSLAALRQQVLAAARVSAAREMLGPIRGGDASGLQETFTLDLVDQCYR
jgi:hypothetical protein